MPGVVPTDEAYPRRAADSPKSTRVVRIVGTWSVLGGEWRARLAERRGCGGYTMQRRQTGRDWEGEPWAISTKSGFARTRACTRRSTTRGARSGAIPKRIAARPGSEAYGPARPGHARDARRPSLQPGRGDARAPGQGDLWGKQRALIEEDEQNAYKLAGIPEDEIRCRASNAIGDDAAEAQPRAARGHQRDRCGQPAPARARGFPEREE